MTYLNDTNLIAYLRVTFRGWLNPRATISMITVKPFYKPKGVTWSIQVLKVSALHSGFHCWWKHPNQIVCTVGCPKFSWLVFIFQSHVMKLRVAWSKLHCLKFRIPPNFGLNRPVFVYRSWSLRPDLRTQWVRRRYFHKWSKHVLNRKIYPY